MALRYGGTLPMFGGSLMVRVRSAHVGGDGEIYAYVQCDGHVRRVGKEAFVPLKTGGYRLEVRPLKGGYIAKARCSV